MGGTHEFWDLGETEVIHPSEKAMGKILRALVQCRGRVHDTYSGELNQDGTWRYGTSSCAVLMRISLPLGKSKLFTELSGFQLSTPPRVGI